MSLFTFICPECGTPRKITSNTGFACVNCKTRYSIGSDKKIHSIRKPKK